MLMLHILNINIFLFNFGLNNGSSVWKISRIGRPWIFIFLFLDTPFTDSISGVWTEKSSAPRWEFGTKSVSPYFITSLTVVDPVGCR